MTNQDFKKLLEESLKPLRKDIQRVESSLRKDLTQVQTDLGQVKIDLTQVQTDLGQVKQTQEQQIVPSLVTIENTIKVYSDMYQLNNGNMKKLEKRVETLEENADIKPPPELILADI